MDCSLKDVDCSSAGAAKSCSIYYNVKPSLRDWAYCKADMPDNQNVEKNIAAIRGCECYDERRL